MNGNVDVSYECGDNLPWSESPSVFLSPQLGDGEKVDPGLVARL